MPIFHKFTSPLEVNNALLFSIVFLSLLQSFHLPCPSLLIHSHLGHYEIFEMLKAILLVLVQRIPIFHFSVEITSSVANDILVWYSCRASIQWQVTAPRLSQMVQELASDEGLWELFFVHYPSCSSHFSLLGKTGESFLFISKAFGPFECIFIAFFSEISCDISEIYTILVQSERWPLIGTCSKCSSNFLSLQF